MKRILLWTLLVAGLIAALIWIGVWIAILQTGIPG
jgi:hypothetical protein